MRDLLVFHVGKHPCALAAEQVSELVLFPALVQSPAQAAILDGYLNLRGSAVPVVPLHSLFHLAVPEPGLYSPIILMQAGGDLVGLRVDRVEQLVSLDEDAIQPYSGGESFNDCATGQFRLGAWDVVVLDGARLLLAKERECLAAWQAAAQQRLDRVHERPPE
jgi:purine-binding chemotaxis protein CheW